MCFGKPKPKAITPAPPPPAPEPVAEQQDVGAPRHAEDQNIYGPGGDQNLRVDRSITSGGLGVGGTGIRM